MSEQEFREASQKYGQLLPQIKVAQRATQATSERRDKGKKKYLEST